MYIYGCEMDTILKNECYFFENQYKSISKKISLVLYCGKYLFFFLSDRFFTRQTGIIEVMDSTPVLGIFFMELPEMLTLLG